MISSPKKEPFRYELEKYSRQYTSNTSIQPIPQWIHISQPNIVVTLENMFPTVDINSGTGEPVLKVVSDQNVLLVIIIIYSHV